MPETNAGIAASQISCLIAVAKPHEFGFVIPWPPRTTISPGGNQKHNEDDGKGQDPEGSRHPVGRIIDHWGQSIICRLSGALVLRGAGGGL